MGTTRTNDRQGARHAKVGRLGLAWVLASSACGDENTSVGLFGEDGSVDAGGTAGPQGTSEGDDDAATKAGSGSESGPSNDTEPKFDVGDGQDTAGDGGIGEGCEKIDFLFVVDNSGSMGAHQNRLINSFGPFMDTIFATVKAQDYHIMVVDSDAGEDISGACEPCSPNSFWCGDWCTAKNDLDVACETTLGAGEVAPYNNEASNHDCGVPGGVRYLTSDLPEADIKNKFACMAKVGVFGSGAERPMSAMVEAVGSQSQPGGCNEGFLRDDAVLVVTVITDDYPVADTPDDASTVGTPQQWYDAVVAAKGGNPDHVVMLGIFNLETSSCVMDGTAGGPLVQPTQKFIDLVDLFGTRGVVGDVCSNPDYSGFFQQAVQLIDTACDEFVPEG